MPETKTCPKCGTELPADAPGGICPKCLMLAGLESKQDAGSGPGMEPTSATSRFVPPEPEELAKRFPQLEILELLGKGGMGAVYKARQPGLDRLVAVKILPPEVGEDPAFAERFTREARALAKLNHPHIVAVHDSGQADDFYYFVMEYVEGVNLRETIRAGQLKPEEALAIVPQICEALQFAHDEGIVHRDIKPENILIDKRGRVKIADFGLAKLLGKAPADFTLTGTHQAMGTPHYMAPEQIEKPLAVDHRADIYSLGVVFYEMLTGELPIGRFAAPSQKVQVDVRLDEVVLKTLEKEPERRYQHVSEVKTDVESITRSTAPPESAAGGVGREDEQLQRWMLSQLPVTKIAAIRAYRAKTGAGLKEAKDAVEAIARKHGIQFTPVSPVSLRERLLGAAIMGTAVTVYVAASVAIILFFQYGGLSPIITWPIIWICFAPAIYSLSVSARRHRGTDRGRLAAFSFGLSLFLYIGLPVLFFLAAPEPVLNWLYQATGATPGRHDVAFLHGVMMAAILGFLAWLIWFWRKLRGERLKRQPSEGKTDVESIASGTQPASPAVGLPTTGAADVDLQAVRRQVRGPAIAIFLAGLLNCLPLVVLIVLILARIIPVWQSGDFLAKPGPVGVEFGVGFIIPLFGVLFFLLPVAGVIMLGARKMMKLELYGLAITASVLAMLPFAPGFLIGLPAGIWALVVLRQPEVKAAFFQRRKGGMPIIATEPEPPPQAPREVKTDVEMIASGVSEEKASARPKAAAVARIALAGKPPRSRRSLLSKIPLSVRLAVWTGVVVGACLCLMPLVMMEWWPWVYDECWEIRLEPQSGAYQTMRLSGERRLYCWGQCGADPDRLISKTPWIATAEIDVADSGSSATLALDSFREQWRWTTPAGQVRTSQDELRSESVVEWMNDAGIDISKPGLQEEATALINLLKDAADGVLPGDKRPRDYRSIGDGVSIGPFINDGGSAWGFHPRGMVGLSPDMVRNQVERRWISAVVFLAIWLPGVLIMVRRHRRRQRQQEVESVTTGHAILRSAGSSSSSKGKKDLTPGAIGGLPASASSARADEPPSAPMAGGSAVARVALVGAMVLGAAAILLGPDISDTMWTVLMLLTFLAFLVDFLRRPREAKGLNAAFCLLAGLVGGMSYLLAVPESVLKWLYDATGGTPGHDDPTFARVLIALLIAWLITQMVRVRKKIAAKRGQEDADGKAGSPRSRTWASEARKRL